MRYLESVLKNIESRDLYPDIKTVQEVPYPKLVIDGREFICLCSNNYLGLSVRQEVKKAAIEAIEKYGIGTCESRLIAGNLQIIEDLETAIADFKQASAAMVFVSGFMTNIGVIPALLDNVNLPGLPTTNNKDNLILSDRLNHKSIIEGCRLSKSPRIIYEHKDMDQLAHILKRHRKKQKLIITDGVFSMDGDMAPLPEIVALAQEYDAMVMVDDAHATGVVGENGRGTLEYYGLEGKVDLVMGTLSKAIGGLGGFLVASPELIKALRVRANSYIFSSTLPPSQAAGIMAALKIIQTEPNLRKQLWTNTNHLKQGLQDMGFDTLNSQTPIIPVHIGDDVKAIEMARILYAKGILAPAVRWPAVPREGSRIRTTVMATHTQSQIDQALDAFREAGKKLALI